MLKNKINSSITSGYVSVLIAFLIFLIVYRPYMPNKYVDISIIISGISLFAMIGTFFLRRFKMYISDSQDEFEEINKEQKSMILYIVYFILIFLIMLILTYFK